MGYLLRIEIGDGYHSYVIYQLDNNGRQFHLNDIHCGDDQILCI